MRGFAWSTALVLGVGLSAPSAGAQPLAQPFVPETTQVTPATPRYPLPSDEQLALRAGAWDDSVALERTGRLQKARVRLDQAWGPHSESYELTVRGAWLSLQLGDYEGAALRYRRARALVGAGPEANQGLASALTGVGYRDLQQGEPGDARAHFRQALALEPEQADAAKGLDLAAAQRFEPEVWGIFVGWSAGGSDAYGGGALLSLPLTLADVWRLRAAYRHLELSQSMPEQAASMRPGSGSGARVRYRQDEGYLGVGYEGHLFGLEAMGIVLSSSATPVMPGQAVRLRLGRRWGLLVDQAALGIRGGVNVQLAPKAFVWPADWLGLSAGARVTLDGVGEEVSGLLGVSVVSAGVELHLRGHLGVERWPVEIDGPSVLDSQGDLTAGGAASLMLPFARNWAFGLQGELQRVVIDDQDTDQTDGVHGSAAIGLRWLPDI